MEHWIILLYKRKSVYQARNYTGIHFTSQISKVAKRVLVSIFVPQLIGSGAYGRNQFAYMLERGATDALAHLVITWLLQCCRNHKIAVYCSNVPGPFDNVNSNKLIRKLKAKGLSKEILAVLKS